MRNLAIVLIFLLFSACSGSHPNDWAEQTYGKADAEWLLKQVNQRILGTASKPYAERPWVLVEERLDHPDVTQVKEVVFHPLNENLVGVAKTSTEVKTLIVLVENYKFIPNKDGKTERAEADGYLLKFLNLEAKQMCTLRIADNSPQTIKAALKDLPTKP